MANNGWMPDSQNTDLGDPTLWGTPSAADEWIALAWMLGLLAVAALLGAWWLTAETRARRRNRQGGSGPRDVGRAGRLEDHAAPSAQPEEDGSG